MAIANDIAHRLFGHSLDDLSQPGRNLLELICDYVRRHPAKTKEGFTRRELREALKWGDTRLRTHLDELVQMEYLAPLSGRFGQAFRYQLLYDPEQADESGRFLAGLKSVEQLRREAQLIGPRGTHLAGVLPNLAPQNGHLAPTSQVAKREVQSAPKPYEQRTEPLSPPNLAPFSGEHMKVNGERSGLYV